MDAAGRVTSVTDAGGGRVLERYAYNADGLPQALRYDWSAYAVGEAGRDGGGTSGLWQGYSRWGWQYLYHGMRFEVQKAFGN